MMAMRLTDAELAARVRAGNRQRAQRQHERRRAAGLVVTTVWLNASTKAALDRMAANRGESLSATMADLLERALAAATRIPLGTTPATTRDKPTAAAELIPDMFLSAPDTTTDKDALMTWVGELLEQGLSGADVARQLNASGKRTASGAAFTGQNILRDYRAWVKKTASVE